MSRRMVRCIVSGCQRRTRMVNLGLTPDLWQCEPCSRGEAPFKLRAAQTRKGSSGA